MICFRSLIEKDYLVLDAEKQFLKKSQTSSKSARRMSTLLVQKSSMKKDALVEIELKMQSHWDALKVHESNPNSKEKYFVSFPYPVSYTANINST